MNMQTGMLSAAKVTPAPGIDTQVVGELKDTANAAKDIASSVWKNLPVIVTDLLIALGVILAGILMLRLIRFMIRLVMHKGRKASDEAVRRAETSRNIISSLVSYVWYFLILAVVMGIFGMDITQILAAAGVVGVAVAFGAQTLVKDILSGLFIWAEKSLIVGDVVTVNEMSGSVEAMTIRTTTIRQFNGNVIIVPNGEIRNIINMSRGFKRAIVNVPCPYEENQERLVAMVKEEMEIAAKEIDGITSVPDVMSIVSFEPNAATLQIAVPCPVGQHWRVERDIRSRVKARFDKEGIIMPHYTIPKT